MTNNVNDESTFNTDRESYSNGDRISNHNKKPRTRWSQELVSEVYEVPRAETDLHPVLFYNKSDYQRFQEKEQQRYDKMMTKQIQKLVREAMSDKLQEAMDRGATPEELEAMMPQTTEEIFAILGGMPTPDIPPPPKTIPMETIHKSRGPEEADSGIPQPEALLLQADNSAVSQNEQYPDASKASPSETVDKPLTIPQRSEEYANGLVSTPSTDETTPSTMESIANHVLEATGTSAPLACSVTELTETLSDVRMENVSSLVQGDEATPVTPEISSEENAQDAAADCGSRDSDDGVQDTDTKSNPIESDAGASDNIKKEETKIHSLEMASVPSDAAVSSEGKKEES